MKEPRYTLTLTPAQLWALTSAYEASFTEPESKNQAERQVQRKLDRLSIKAHRHRQIAKGLAK